MSILDKLTGKKIIKVTFSTNATFSINNENDRVVESPISLEFKDYVVNIYNPFTIRGTDTDISLQILENLTLVSIVEQEEKISLRLEKNIELTIDLREESFNGPEALSLYGPDNLIVVWN